jgi:hypothetical protein
MALISGPTVGQALADSNNALAKLAASAMDDAQLIDEMFLRILNRPATPEEIESIAAVLRELPKQHEALIARLQQYEQQLAAETAEKERQRQQAVAEAKKPRPPDPKLQQLRDKLAEVSKALPADPKLKQLRNDVQMSAQQLETARLTFAQDLAWALINSPAFLFNR